ncbi:hypothetical protein Tco_1236819 [Tanacetum coccineum]
MKGAYLQKEERNHNQEVTNHYPPHRTPSEALPTPSPAPTSEVPNEPQTDSSPAQTSEVPFEQQTDQSPRPSPTTTIPDSIPETSGENLGGHSSSDKSLSGMRETENAHNEGVEDKRNGDENKRLMRRKT